MINRNRPQPRTAPPRTPRRVWPAWVEIPAPDTMLGTQLLSLIMA